MPQGMKQVRRSWKPSDQAWRTLAQCLGYSTPLDATSDHARVVPGIFAKEGNEENHSATKPR